VNVLALDTATTALGLSLRAGDATSSVLLQAGLRHAETLLPQVQRLLQEAHLEPRELDLIVCSLGPGSFTGIRIGLAAAKGLAFGTGGRCALTGVSTLAGLAWRLRGFPGAVVAVNASLRRRHHAGLFRLGRLEGEYLELELPQLAERLAAEPLLFLTGSGAEGLQAALRERRDGEGLFAAGSPPADPLGLLEAGLARYREHGPEPELAPLYLRKSEAEIQRDRA
jgi:tRNA threonylcarbamoyladenosine biosynthesis protein TsaB